MADKKRSALIVLSALLLLTAAIGGTLAYLATQTKPVVNTFTPSEVTCEVTETFDGTEKKNVNVTNTGNIDAYLRVRLVTYRVNSEGDRIGGTAQIPSFTIGTGWVQNGDYYYYIHPVAPGKQPAKPLAASMTLVNYNDVDGGKQVVEVTAEAIQAEGVGGDNGLIPAVTLAWGIGVNADGTLNVQ